MSWIAVGWTSAACWDNRDAPGLIVDSKRLSLRTGTLYRRELLAPILF